jgi:Haem-binding domain
MPRWIIVSGFGVLIVLVAIQFIRVDSSNPPVTGDVPGSPAAKAILRRALLRLPFERDRVAVVCPDRSDLLVDARDVRKGRSELNFSTWNEYSTQQQVKKLKESWKEVAEGEMPPWHYLPAHRDARLMAEDRAVLRQWAQEP